MVFSLVHVCVMRRASLATAVLVATLATPVGSHAEKSSNSKSSLLTRGATDAATGKPLCNWSHDGLPDPWRGSSGNKESGVSLGGESVGNFECPSTSTWCPRSWKCALIPLWRGAGDTPLPNVWNYSYHLAGWAEDGFHEVGGGGDGRVASKHALHTYMSAALEMNAEAAPLLLHLRRHVPRTLVRKATPASWTRQLVSFLERAASGDATIVCLDTNEFKMWQLSETDYFEDGKAGEEHACAKVNGPPHRFGAHTILSLNSTSSLSLPLSSKATPPTHSPMASCTNLRPLTTNTCT
jgi:hypothetical protein